MSAVLLGQAEVHSPEWHALRAGGIGGSEIAAVVGLSKWTSAYALWHRKRGQLPEQSLNDAMDWGNRLEPVITQWFREQHPDWVVVATPGTYAHEDRDWQRCNPDGLVWYSRDAWEADAAADALLQVKTARYPDGWGKESVPIEYACQEQHELDIFGAQTAHMAVLFGGNEPREYVIEADATDQATLRTAAGKFWESIQSDERPPLDCSDHTYQAVRELNPNIDRDLGIDLPAELWREYLDAKSAINEGEDALTLVKSKVLDLMGHARLARVGGIDVLRRQAASNKVPYLREVA